MPQTAVLDRFRDERGPDDAPQVAVVTNIQPDHLDFFHSEEAYFKVFDDFAGLVTPDTGYLVVCAEDEHAAHRPDDRAAPAHEERPAEHDGGDRHQVVAALCADGRLAHAEPRQEHWGEQHDGGGQQREHAHHHQHRMIRHPRRAAAPVLAMPSSALRRSCGHRRIVGGGWCGADLAVRAHRAGL